MTWFKVDDQLAFHPKTIAAGNAAMGLWVRAGSWASAQLTDGYITGEIVPILGAKKTDIERLVTSGLWIPNGRGFRFHQWEERNPRREEVQEARTSKSARAILGNHKRWHEERGKTDPECPHCNES